MLTKNYYHNMELVMGGDDDKVLVIQDGTTVSATTSSLNNYSQKVFQYLNYYSTSGYGVRFGTGTTAPTVDDYNLEAAITSGLTVSYQNDSIRVETADYMEYTTAFGVKATSDVTISEIGLFAGYKSSPGGSAKYYMIDRTVLDEPITILAGESKQLTYSLRFNYKP